MAPVAPSRRRVNAAFAALALGLLLAALDETALTTALPTIVGDLGDLDRLSWIVSVYILAATIAAPVFGRLGDRHGRKRLFEVAIVVFVVGSLLCALAQTLTELVAFRAVQGAGAGGLIVGSQAIAGDILPPRRRGRYQGYIAATLALAALLGPPLGGLLAESASWRWIFLLNLPLGIASLAVVALAVPDPLHRTAAALDPLEVALLVAATAPLVLVLTWGGSEYAWDSLPIVGLACAAAAGCAFFWLRTRRAAAPIFPAALFHNKLFVTCCAAGLAVNLARWSAIVYVPVYLNVVRGFSPTGTGVRLLPLIVGALATSIWSGRAISATGRYRAYPIAGTLVLAAALLLLSRLGRDTPEAVVEASLLLAGVGMGLCLQALVLVLQNAVPDEEVGSATATATFFRTIGGAIGVAVFGAIFATRLAGSGLGDVQATPAEIAGRAGAADAVTGALQSVFLWSVPFGALAVVLTLLVRQVPLRDAPLDAVTGRASR